MMNELQNQRHSELERLLVAAYKSQFLIQKRILITNDPLEKRELQDQKKVVQDQIIDYKLELTALKSEVSSKSED
ncbi:MAG: hypothetical protein WCS37_10105 [Chloroflexota bacterium]|nr:hypothetical protein [Chloroflexota bacterium]